MLVRSSARRLSQSCCPETRDLCLAPNGFSACACICRRQAWRWSTVGRSTLGVACTMQTTKMGPAGEVKEHDLSVRPHLSVPQSCTELPSSDAMSSGPRQWAMNDTGLGALTNRLALRCGRWRSQVRVQRPDPGAAAAAEGVWQNRAARAHCRPRRAPGGTLVSACSFVLSAKHSRADCDLEGAEMDCPCISALDTFSVPQTLCICSPFSSSFCGCSACTALNKRKRGGSAFNILYLPSRHRESPACSRGGAGTWALTWRGEIEPPRPQTRAWVPLCAGQWP